ALPRGPASVAVVLPAVIRSPRMQHALSHRRRRAIAPAVAVIAWLGALAPAAAQVERSYAEEPTQGLRLPTVPLAGEHDAFSVARNPAGLRFLRGLHVGLGVDVATDDATGPGPGGGLYLGGPLGGGLLPTIGIGLGVEILRPSRA